MALIVAMKEMFSCQTPFSWTDAQLLPVTKQEKKDCLGVLGSLKCGLETPLLSGPLSTGVQLMLGSYISVN